MEVPKKRKVINANDPEPIVEETVESGTNGDRKWDMKNWRVLFSQPGKSAPGGFFLLKNGEESSQPQSDKIDKAEIEEEPPEEEKPQIKENLNAPLRPLYENEKLFPFYAPNLKTYTYH
jgi:hypothetical protein